MFENTGTRYITSTINDRLHGELQMILWGLIDEQQKEGLELDYLQVFELKVKDGKQHIIHRQEEPHRKREWIYPLKQTTPVDESI